MIITKTPYRISFCGGGTDIPSFYKKFNGNVLATTINKHMHVLVKKQTGIIEYKYKVHWSQSEFKNKISDINHPIVRETLKLLKIDYPIEISSFADIPASTGLGSSSAFTVGLVKALYALSGRNTSKRQIAEIASKIEVNLLKRRIGRQDHYSTSYGNLNKIDFFKNGKIKINKIKIANKNRKILEDSIILLYTNQKRNADNVLKKQHNPTKNQIQNLNSMKLEVNKFIKILKSRKIKFKYLGKLLNQQWFLKKKINNISNSKIDKMYNKTISMGAYGGKLLGAGKGGFLLILSNKKTQNKITKFFGEKNIIKIKFENNGSQIIYKKKISI